MLFMPFANSKLNLLLLNLVVKGMGLGEDEAPIALGIGVLLCIVIPYLLGSINPAILISKLVYHEDIRSYGSGNAGTTNMLRTYGKGAALATFLLDLGKAAVSFLLGVMLAGYGIGSAIAGFFVMFGHMFPLYYHFKGGKGVACLAMICLLTDPLTFGILVGLFIIIVVGTRYISLGSVMSAMLYPMILAAFANYSLNVAAAIVCACFVIFMHRENIKRLWAGKEHKISFSKHSKESTEEQKK